MDGSDIICNFVGLLASNLIEIMKILKEPVDIMSQDLASAIFGWNRVQVRTHGRSVGLRSADADTQRYRWRRRHWRTGQRYRGRRALRKETMSQNHHDEKKHIPGVAESRHDVLKVEKAQSAAP